MHILSRQGRIACALVALAACSDDGDGGITEPTTGSAQVTIATTGRVLDRDGYTLSVDGGTPSAVPANHTLTVASLTPGAHTITVSGVAENCQPTGSVSQTVQVVAGAAAPVQFAVQCAANRMAFTSTPDATSPFTSVFVQRTDGTGRTRLVGPAVTSRIDWSPDGYRIAYAAPLDSTTARREIRVVDADSGTSRAVIIPNMPFAVHPAWSPDGTRFAFTGRPEGGLLSVYTVRTDGSDLKLLSPEAGGKSMPVWSPDGTRVAYLRINGDVEEVWVVKADGSERQMVDSHVYHTYAHLDWSPDGTRLLFAALNGPHTDLYTVRADGTGLTLLTTTPTVSERLPTYLPDGRIGFNISPRGGTDYDIWIMNPDGTGAVNLTNSPGTSEAVPAWQ